MLIHMAYTIVLDAGHGGAWYKIGQRIEMPYLSAIQTHSNEIQVFSQT